MTDAHGVESDRPLLEGRYQLGAALGRTMGSEIFRAHDHLLERAVAVKMFARAGDDTLRARSQERELTTSAALHHPGLVTLLDAGSVDGRTFLVTELVEGDTLDRVLSDSVLDVATVVGVGRDVADALGHVHAHGFTHGGVAAEHVLVRHDGRAVLIHAATVGGVTSAATDVHALGLLLLEALGVAPSGRTAGPTLPAGLTPLLQRMTAERPEDRPTAWEARNALAAVLGAWSDQGATPAARPLPSPPSKSPSSSPSRPRRPVLLAAGAATVALAIGLGGWWATAAPWADPAVPRPTSAAASGAMPADRVQVPMIGAPIVPRPTWPQALAAATARARAADSRGSGTSTRPPGTTRTADPDPDTTTDTATPDPVDDGSTGDDEDRGEDGTSDSPTSTSPSTSASTSGDGTDDPAPTTSAASQDGGGDHGAGGGGHDSDHRGDGSGDGGGSGDD